MAAKADCHAHRPIIVSDSSGYLASLTAAETGCGTSDAPWLIEVMPGQRINVTLFDFSPPDVALHGQVLHSLLPTFNRDGGLLIGLKAARHESKALPLSLNQTRDPPRSPIADRTPSSLGPKF